MIKVLPTTGHEGPEEEQLYSSTLPSTSAIDGGRGGWSTPRPNNNNNNNNNNKQFKSTSDTTNHRGNWNHLKIIQNIQ